MTVEKCRFTSVWDDEAVIITTDANIDLSTGRVFNIGISERLGEYGEGVGSLDREFIRINGIDKEFPVKPFDEVSCAEIDISELPSEISLAGILK